MIETSGGFGGDQPLQKGFGAFLKEVLAQEGGENVAQDILWEAITALAYDPEKPIFSLTDENAILNPLRAGKQFAGGALVAGGLGVGAYAAAAKIRGFVVSAYADGYVSKQTAADLLDEIDAAFPGAAKLMEDAHLTGAGPQLEVPEGLDINDPLAQAAKNDIMKAQGLGDPASQTAEDAGENFKIGSFDELPSNAKNTYKGYEGTGWRGNYGGQAPGTKAGKAYHNTNDLLPKTDSAGNTITYQEFDINAPTVGVGRDAERFVIGSDGSIFYTDSHYGDIISPKGLPPFVKIK